MRFFLLFKFFVKGIINYVLRFHFFIQQNISGNFVFFPQEIMKLQQIKFKKGIRIGRSISIKIHRNGCIKLLDNIIIESNCILESLKEDIIIGKNSTLNQFSIIRAYGKVVIGEGVRIGPHVQIMAMNHNFDNPELFIYKQGISGKGITIGDNVWIGGNVTILDGIEIGRNCIIGAGSIVTRDIQSNHIAVGNPAKVIKKLNFK